MQDVLARYYDNNASGLRSIVSKAVSKCGFFVQQKDMDDLYSLAGEVLSVLLKTYDDNQGNFDGYFYSCLVNRIKSWQTMGNRKKRRLSIKVDGNVEYIHDIPIDTQIGKNASDTLEGVLKSDKTVEDEAFDGELYSEKVCEYLNRLSTTQQRVLKLMTYGYTKEEICKKLEITYQQYNLCYEAIHAYRNTKILIGGV